MEKSDVIVVGAGIAGLTAAWELSKSGRSVQVLEARDRVGGRTMGHTLENGFVVEMGAQWVGPYQTEVLQLIEQLGLEASPTYETGLSITVFEDQVVHWETEYGTFGMPEASLYEVGRLKEELETLADTVPVSAPWKTPNAQELDHQSVQQWLKSSTSDPWALAFYESFVTGLFYGEPSKMSLLQLLFLLQSNGKLDNMLAASGGNQDSRIVGGSQRISERLAEELGEDVVRLNAPVRAIRQDDDEATVTFDSDELSAEHVVVAIPTILANQLSYSPALTEFRRTLTDTSTEVSIAKAQIAYSTPFWRESGLSGVINQLTPPYRAAIDSSPADASLGILACFNVSTSTHPFASLSTKERRTHTIEWLAGILGPAASSPLEYVDQVWINEEFSRGCYGGRFGVGTWTQGGTALRQPFGRIHWAGTETSDISNAYMDGAVRSGKRAAAEILAGKPAEASEHPSAVAGGNE